MSENDTLNEDQAQVQADAEPEAPQDQPLAHYEEPSEATNLAEQGDLVDLRPLDELASFDLKAVVEGALFAHGAALSIKRIQSLFGEGLEPEAELIESVIQEIAEDYRGRGIVLNKVSTGYRFQVSQGVGPWVSRLWEEKPAKYSRALLETLALIAYRQPVTRGEIEEVRGVSVSSSIVKTMLERDWIRVVGHKEVPGRPAMYGTTKAFLDYFNLQHLGQLPSLPELQALDLEQMDQVDQTTDERDENADAEGVVREGDAHAGEVNAGNLNEGAVDIDAVQDGTAVLDQEAADPTVLH